MRYLDYVWLRLPDFVARDFQQIWFCCSTLESLKTTPICRTSEQHSKNASSWDISTDYVSPILLLKIFNKFDLIAPPSRL